MLVFASMSPCARFPMTLTLIHRNPSVIEETKSTTWMIIYGHYAHAVRIISTYKEE